MTWNGKSVIIIAAERAEEWVKETQTGNQYSSILSSFNRKIALLKENPQYGIHIQKRMIPRQYKTEGICNLWKFSLPKWWRCTHTIETTETEIQILILGVYSHKDYEKAFGYG